MVEYSSGIDAIFGALSDPTRRDILERVADGPLTVNQIALEYDMSVAAISKHLKVLFDAGVISKRKQGRYVFVSLEPTVINEASVYLSQYDAGQQVSE